MHYSWVAICALSTWQVAAWPAELARSYGAVNYTAIFAPGLSPGASIHFPSDADYNTTTTQRYSAWKSPTYSAVIRPDNEADVQLIIKRANANNIPFFATGNGHGAEPGFGSVQGWVNIDLQNLRQNDLDAKNNRLTIGPGLHFEDFEGNLAKAGKLMPVGNIYCVNMIGATIGATVGPYQGLVGLAIDFLQSVRLVTAAGDLVTASETENPDLFWAVRGAGANFGVVTQAVFKLIDAPNGGNLISADFAYDSSKNVSIFNLIQSMEKTWPKEMGFNFFGGFNHTTNKTSLTIAMSYFGTRQQAQPTLDKFLALGPIQQRIQTLPWAEHSKAQAFGASGTAGCEKGQWTNHYAIGAKKVDAPTYIKTFQQYADFAKGNTWFEGLYVIQHFQTDVTLALPKSKQGVYPGREISTFIILDNYYDGPAHDDAVYKYAEPIRKQLVATSGFDSLKVYLNYGFGDEGPEVWYGKDNLPRLVGLKNKWDPKHKFGPGNPIPYRA